VTKLKVEISEWSPLWGEKFSRLGAEIRASLGNRSEGGGQTGATIGTLLEGDIMKLISLPKRAKVV